MSEKDYSFEISFYERLDSLHDKDTRVMEILAHLYTRMGRIQEGLAMDQRLAELRPNDPMVHYNLACSLALVGQAEEAMHMLKLSVQLGYGDFDWMMKDPDLASLRKQPGFVSFLHTLKH